MGAQNGKDLLVKVDMTGDGQFETIAGLRATRVSFNAESVDVTSLESQGGMAGTAGGCRGAVGCNIRVWCFQGCGHRRTGASVVL